MSVLELGRVLPKSKGVYDQNNEYEVTDIVQYKGTTYMANKDVPKNEIPSKDSAYWDVFVEGSVILSDDEPTQSENSIWLQPY